MNNYLKKYFLFFFLIVGIIYSCNNEEEYPIIPEINFEGFTKLWNPNTMIYERGVLKISFKDGDGDIGLKNSETEPPYDYNLFVKYYEYQNGDTVRVVIADSNEFNARIPMLTPQGSNKAIKGDIEDTLFMYNYLADFDTIMFDVYLVDRALHKSNTVSTGWFLRN
ncbi:MAG: hypothetical protein K8R86_00605 [Bacteroidales bacterium]|nr:hypothetical protein [Bacteroidales bacterium]